MDNEFKIPTIEPKLKVITKKTTPQSDVDELNENAALTLSVNESHSLKVETDSIKETKCPYVMPKWSKPPDTNLPYNFEVLKSGQIVEEIKNLQNKAVWTIGKLPDNCIVMAHPTISRYHAVLQYRPDVIVATNKNDSDSDDDDNGNLNLETIGQKSTIEKGWYLYDLNSTHGTFVNKMKIPSKTYVRIRVGYMLKFGASTRNYILQGPDFDAEAESELTITEMKEIKLKKLLEEKVKLEDEEKRKEEEGISWGMSEDAEEETDLSHNPFAATNNEDLFLQDPKKTLRGYFEREGLNLDYKIEEVSNGTYKCRIELPITDSIGRSIMAEFTHKGKKKECVVQCALEACRILDRNGLLRQANHEPRKRKIESSDDDDDEYYDRTVEAEEKRRRKAGGEENITLSYEQLLDEEKKLQLQMIETEKRIEQYQQMEKISKQNESMDVDLDDFMSGLSNEKKMDKADVRKCRFELQRITADIQKVKKLINIARPFQLPPLKKNETNAAGQIKKKFELPLFGKKKTFGFDKLKQFKKSIESNDREIDQNAPIEEFDEDEDEIKKSSDKPNTENVIETVADNLPVMETPKVTERCDEQINEFKIVKENDDVTRKGQSQMSEKKLPKPKTKIDTQNHTITSSQSTSTDETNEKINTEQIANTQNKNNKRNRNKIRHQIDVDDTGEDLSPQKYSGWMPPSNQSGDGITDLNSKYGY